VLSSGDFGIGSGERKNITKNERTRKRIGRKERSRIKGRETEEYICDN
jgi:hypothetical protein